MTEVEELKLFMLNASGDFLTEPLPTNFDELDEGVLHKFIQENLWQAFEDYYDEPHQIYDFIEVSAYSTMRFVRENYLLKEKQYES